MIFPSFQTKLKGDFANVLHFHFMQDPDTETKGFPYLSNLWYGRFVSHLDSQIIDFAVTKAGWNLKLQIKLVYSKEFNNQMCDFFLE